MLSLNKHLHFTNGKTLTAAAVNNAAFWADICSLAGGFYMTKEELKELRANPRPLYIPIASPN